MRKMFGGLVIVLGLGAMCVAQDNNAAARAGAGGQGTTGQVGQGQTVQGQQTTQGQAGQGQAAPGQAAPGQAAPGQAAPGQVRPAQTGQFGQAVQPVQPGQPNPFGQNQQGQQGHHSDQEIAACLACEADNEIAISKLAESKAQSDEVKQFAQQMIKEHSPGAQEMRQLAGQLLQQGQQNRGQHAGGGLDWVSIKKQIADQCLASTKEELQGKSSREFDHCYMGLQIVAHMKVIDELKVLRNYASSDLRQKLDKELEMAQHHLKLAKDIEQKVDPSERLSRKPNDGSK